MQQDREIWVLPDTYCDEKTVKSEGCGLLMEARRLGNKIDGGVTAVVFSASGEYPEPLKECGADRLTVYKNDAFTCFCGEICAVLLADEIKKKKPWMMLMSNGSYGRELGPRLSHLLQTGLVTNCVKIDLRDADNPVFYRPVLNGQQYQSVMFKTAPMLVSIDSTVLSTIDNTHSSDTKVTIKKPELAETDRKIEHLGSFQADYRTLDITEADLVIGVGMGTIESDLLDDVQELAKLVEGTLGATRPVIDEGKFTVDRLIGQTGKMIRPDHYFAMGISGATHHIGGIQDSGKIISVNNDNTAPIFQSSDIGMSSDLRDIVPGLIKKIKQAREDGEIL